MAYARRELELEPWDEEAHRLLMRALANSGQRSAALGQYETCRRLLKQELGAEPSLETRELSESIKGGSFGQAIEPNGTTADRLSTKSNLQNQLTSFVGREEEIERVCELVRRQRLVTLTGAGGVGKTRLALKAAEALLPTFPDGAWLVELAPLSDPDLVPQACVQALGFIAEPSIPPARLLTHHLEKKSCCWCWITASTSSPPAPNWSTSCSRAAPT